MEITTLQIVLVFIVACIAGMGSILDEFQFHRPLIACTLVGIVLGDMKTGIIIGGTLEMIALGWMNIGAAVAPDAALASIISTILVIAGHQSIGAGIALAIPLAAAGQVLTIIVRTITVAFQHAADKAADNGNLTAISWIHVSSLFLQAMRVAIHTQIRQAMRVLIHTHISCRLLVEGSAPKPPLNTEFHSVATCSANAFKGYTKAPSPSRCHGTNRSTLTLDGCRKTQ